MVARTLFLELLALYKAKFHGRIQVFFDINEAKKTGDWLQKEYKANTDEAELKAVLQGKSAFITSEDDNSKAELQRREGFGMAEATLQGKRALITSMEHGMEAAVIPEDGNSKQDPKEGLRFTQ